MTTRLSDMLNVIRFHVPIPVDFNTAGTADEEPVLIAPIACTVTGVTLVPETAITGHATNYAPLSLENKGAAGTGTDEIASFAFDTPTTDAVAAFAGDHRPRHHLRPPVPGEQGGRRHRHRRDRVVRVRHPDHRRRRRLRRQGPD